MVLVLALVVGIKLLGKYQYCNSEYLIVNDTYLSHQEYDFYYYQYYYNYLNNYGSIINYMAVDTTKSLDEQMYDEKRTFKEYFEDCCIDQIITIDVLNKLGEEDKYIFDLQGEYDKFLDTVNKSLPQNKSIDDYLKKYYGDYATLDNTETLLKKSFYASSYKNYLLENKGEIETKVLLDKLKSDYEVTFK